MIPAASPRTRSGSRRKAATLIPAPTVMKKSPSSRPLKGAMSDSSSWRNSELASTTPARKVPSAGDRSDQHHQQGDAGDDQQGDGGEHLGQARRMDEAEERPRAVDAGEDDRRDHPQRDQRDAPTRQPLDQRHGVMRLVTGIGGAALDRPVDRQRHLGAQRQQGQGDQHRDHRDILRQQHGKGRPPARGLHKPLLGQGLQHDGGGGQGKDHADRQRRLPEQPHRDAARHHQPAGQHDLQPAEPDQPVPHVPKGARLQFEADEEKHHDHAELGEMQEIFGILHETQPRTDHQPGQQVAQHRPEPEPRGDRHGDHGGSEEDGRLEKKILHARGPCPSPHGSCVGSGGLRNRLALFRPPAPSKDQLVRGHWACTVQQGSAASAGSTAPPSFSAIPSGCAVTISRGMGCSTTSCGLRAGEGCKEGVKLWLHLRDGLDLLPQRL